MGSWFQRVRVRDHHGGEHGSRQEADMMLEPYLKVGGKEGANWEWQGLSKPQISLPVTHLLQ